MIEQYKESLEIAQQASVIRYDISHESRRKICEALIACHAELESLKSVVDNSILPVLTHIESIFKSRDIFEGLRRASEMDESINQAIKALVKASI